MATCMPCGPVVCYKFEDGPGNKKDKKRNKPSNQTDSEDDSDDEGDDGKGKGLKRVKSRELRASIHYIGCHCIKRNGLQHDCRRTGCQGEPPCLIMPDPMCGPSQLMRHRGLADPAPLVPHLKGMGGSAQKEGGGSGPSGAKRFIICEMKGMMAGEGAGGNKSGGGCCNTGQRAITQKGSECCADEVGNKTKNKGKLQSCLDGSNIELAPNVYIVEYCENVNDFSKITGGKVPRAGQLKRGSSASECDIPGCQHAKPPPPCIWPQPCKADCFETPAGVGPGGVYKSAAEYYSKAGRSETITASKAIGQTKDPTSQIKTSKFKIRHLTPSGAAGKGDFPPLLVMKLC